MTALDDRDHVSQTALDATRRLLPKLAAATGLLYVGFAVLYALRLPRLDQAVLSALTMVSAIVFLSFSRWTWHRSLSVRQTHLAIGGLGSLIVVNVTTEYGLSGVALHGVGFVILQIAFGVVLPTTRWLVAFMLATVLAWLITTLALEIRFDPNDAVLGFVAGALTGTAVFYTRSRMTAVIDALRRSAEQSRDRELREILDKNPDAVLLHRSGEIVYANAALVAHLHLDGPDRLVGAQLSTLVPAHGAERLAAMLSGGRGEPTHTLELLRADGQAIVVEISEPRTIHFEGEPAIMWVGRDITESREALHAQLLLAERLAVAGTLAAGLAHELNNPLASVKLNMSSLQRVLPGSDDVRELLVDITEGIRRITSIVQDLESISPDHGDHVDRADVTGTLQHAIELAGNEIRHRAEIESDLKEVPRVLINKGKLMQALVNLLISAARAIGGGSRDRRIKVRTSIDPAGRAVVEISDNGEGMPEAVARRLFEPFFTTRTDEFGAGLGLYYCHSVITAAGGTIDVDSKPGRGTTFRVGLPPAPLEPPAAAPMIGSPAGPGRLHVLVIDDELAVGRAIKRVLSRCDVTVSTTGADALARYDELDPDLVLCDIMMPGLSGQAVYEKLRERHPDIRDRIVFMTGGAFTKKARMFVDTTDVLVLKKPVEVETLHKLIADREERAAVRSS